MPHMLMPTGEAYWHGTLACNERLASVEHVPIGVFADDAWDLFHAHFLAKCNAPTLSKLLRPNAILKARAKLWPRCFFPVLEGYDTLPSAAHMGSKQAYSCAEFVTVVGILLEKRADWGLQAHAAQLTSPGHATPPLMWSSFAQCAAAPPLRRFHLPKPREEESEHGLVDTTSDGLHRLTPRLFGGTGGIPLVPFRLYVGVARNIHRRGPWLVVDTIVVTHVAWADDA